LSASESASRPIRVRLVHVLLDGSVGRSFSEASLGTIRGNFRSPQGVESAVSGAGDGGNVASGEMLDTESLVTRFRRSRFDDAQCHRSTGGRATRQRPYPRSHVSYQATARVSAWMRLLRRLSLENARSVFQLLSLGTIVLAQLGVLRSAP